MLATRRDIANGVSESGHPAALGVADVLSLAATPTFAIMALLTSAFGGGPADAICAAAHGSPLGGMAPMYLLMSAFHLAPWLKLLAKAMRSVAPAASHLPRDIAPTKS
jgi:hypothetical protein